LISCGNKIHLLSRKHLPKKLTSYSQTKFYSVSLPQPVGWGFLTSKHLPTGAENGDKQKSYLKRQLD